jgi:hypothetical protein
MTESLNCPNCGAPLKITAQQNWAVCLYCNATLRLEPQSQPEGTSDIAGRSPTLASTLDDAEMGKVKQFLLDGQKESALELYSRRTGASEEDAREALTDLRQKLSLDVVRQQQLTTGGILIVGVYGLLTVVGMYMLFSGGIHWLISLAAMLYGAWMLYFYFPAVASTLAFRKGKPAKAQVLKLAEVGKTHIGRQRVRVFKLLVEIQPLDGSAPYPAEMLLPIREENTPRAQPGTSILVKYLPQQPERVIFDVS